MHTRAKRPDHPTKVARLEHLAHAPLAVDQDLDVGALAGGVDAVFHGWTVGVQTDRGRSTPGADPGDLVV